MSNFMHPDNIRSLFSNAISDMYRHEVPQYGALIDLVRDVNTAVLEKDTRLREQFEASGELTRLDIERHGAIRVGTAEELKYIRRIFALMGMFPVGYYDLSVAGLPVHSTAFRPITDSSLFHNPFRVFTSLIRLDLLEDSELAAQAADILSKRRILTDRAVTLLEHAENAGGMTNSEAKEFVEEVLETFRWHSDATVSSQTYQELLNAHPLIADVVSFRGPHINHLTPRTLDIDAVQKAMPKRGIIPKAIIEGPAPRKADILLRQTSFKALQESVNFEGAKGHHTARFGEIEQRGVALKPEGRALYDLCLAKTRSRVQVSPDGSQAMDYMKALGEEFSTFPDDFDELRRKGLAFFRYRAVGQNIDKYKTIDALISSGHLIADPQTYEDFLPVSAAGIFQSNLGSDGQKNLTQSANREAFEKDIGTEVVSEMALYQRAETESLFEALTQLGQEHLMTACQ